jgi:hypothetical protein
MPATTLIRGATACCDNVAPETVATTWLAHVEGAP